MLNPKQIFLESIQTKQAIIDKGLFSPLVTMAEHIALSLKQGGKLLLCGNGGSAADAQHLAAELLIRLRSSLNRPSLPALTLATDMSTVTACGNDYSFNEIFSRPLSSLGKKGDILLGITTSGQSPNVLEAFKCAKNMGLTTCGFLGGTGGEALAYCDIAFVVPSFVTARIQESHITAGHIVMELVEDLLLDNKR
ncbi:MAG: SIS domain-containing protein [Proteobacteria bacterium]|nr:SIS domain-containing protein [Pseudomonadota bacterium]